MVNGRNIVPIFFVNALNTSRVIKKYWNNLGMWKIVYTFAPPKIEVSTTRVWR